MAEIEERKARTGVSDGLPCYRCDSRGRLTNKEDFVNCPRKWEAFEKQYKRYDSTQAKRPEMFRNSHSITTSKDLVDEFTKRSSFSDLKDDQDCTYAQKKGKKVRISDGWECTKWDESWEVTINKIGVCMICGKHGRVGMKFCHE